MPATIHYSTKPSIESHNKLPLADHIKQVVTTYFKNMIDSGMSPENLYEIVMAEVELPLIQATMEYTGNNQFQAAKILGINRGTFRKKLAFYGML